MCCLWVQPPASIVCLRINGPLVHIDPWAGAPQRLRRQEAMRTIIGQILRETGQKGGGISEKALVSELQEAGRNCLSGAKCSNTHKPRLFSGAGQALCHLANQDRGRWEEGNPQKVLSPVVTGWVLCTRHNQQASFHSWRCKTPSTPLPLGLLAGLRNIRVPTIRGVALFQIGDLTSPSDPGPHGPRGRLSHGLENLKTGIRQNSLRNE